ncbi:hypothetical protein O0L34_g14795 [Tuta absoluta]|nr:hypothetical protein O0L34_g14795 [Tuta absoluta]
MSCSCKFVCAPKVDIDGRGIFKYVLVQTYDENNQPWSIIVRGYARHEWHNNIFDEVKEKMKPLKCEPLGGGKIAVDPEDEKIYVYGTSAGYGQADHEVAAELIKEAFPKHEVFVGQEPPKKEEKWNRH